MVKKRLPIAALIPLLSSANRHRDGRQTVDRTATMTVGEKQPIEKAVFFKEFGQR